MERRKSSRIIVLLFFIPFFIWILLQFFGTFVLDSDSVDDLSGSVGLSDNNEIIDDMSQPWNTVYGCGDILCHQKFDRSISMNGNQMPFCTRCTAIWLGIVIGLGFMIFYTINLDEKFIYVLLIGLIPIGIDGIMQLFGFWESNNIIRFITGILAGIVCGVAIGIIIDETKELIVNKKQKIIKS